jgi:L-lactate dehydrogenase complex protein LldG
VVAGAAVSARELILARVRAALVDVPDDEPAAWDPSQDSDEGARYNRHSELERAAIVALFAQRCGEYRASITHAGRGTGAVRGAIEAACARHRVDSLVAPADLPEDWRPGGVAVALDEPALANRRLDRADGALTGCALAIAETGTIVLDAGAVQGRRALTLLPDLHICIVRAEQIVASVPEAFELLAASVRESARPLTLISGPSATSDIELKRVEGVHGPRRLEVVIVP